MLTARITGRRRGLAAVAVTALAVTGLGLPGPAQAADEGIRLLTPFGAEQAVSFRAPFPFAGPGSRSAYPVVAEAADPGASVQFSYRLADGGAEAWVPFGEPVPVNGGFAVDELDVDTALEGRSVTLRAVATPADAGAPPVTSILSGVSVLEAPSDAGPPHAARITLGSAGDFFAQPYADEARTGDVLRVSGESSATSGTVELSWWDPSAAGFRGQTAAQVASEFVKLPNSGVRGPGSFAAGLDITAYGAETGDTIAVGVDRDTSTAAPLTVREQTIGSIIAFEQESVPTGQDGDVSLGVLDTNGAPVAGAQVFGGPDAGELVGYTDGDGVVRTTLAGGATRSYWVNTSDVDAFESGTDPVIETTQPSYEPVATSLQGVVADGDVFDRDEYAPGDLGVLVRDQRNNPGPEGTAIDYRLYPEGTPPPASPQRGTAGTGGYVAVDLPADDGTWTFDYRFASDDVAAPYQSTTFTVGEAELVLDPATDTVRAPSGGRIDYAGTLMVGGEPLPGRAVDLGYVRGVEYVPGRVADAGIVTEAGRAIATQVVTDADGGFTVQVRDGADRRSPTEAGGRLLASTGETLPTEDSTLAGDADAETGSSTQFGAGRGQGRIFRTGESNGARPDVLDAFGAPNLAGEQVRVFRIGPRGGRTLVAARDLGPRGRATGIRIEDGNGDGLTTYVVRLMPSERVTAAESNPIRLR